MKKKIRRLVGPTIMNRVDQVRHELRYRPAAAWASWKEGRRISANRARLQKYFADLRAYPPEVLLGANIGGAANGILHHMAAIRNFSRLKVELSPPDWLLQHLTHHDFHTTFRDEVMSFEPRGIRVLHSNVFPYYIQWCRRQRDAVDLWVHTYHSPYTPLNDQHELEPWEKEFHHVLMNEARHADVRISVSKWQQKELRSEYEIETIHIPNGVNVGNCDLGDASRFRARFGDDPFILYVGRNEMVKNPQDLLRLAMQMPTERFVMLGGGLTAEAVRERWGIDAPFNVTFGGSVSHIQVQDALAAASLVVTTSIREGLPTLVLEALAHRRAVVVSNEPGSVEVIDNGRFGMIYETGNVDDLEAKVRAALEGPRENAEARNYVLETYDWRVVAPQLDAIYSGHR